MPTFPPRLFFPITRVLLGGNSVIDVFIMSAGILQLNAMHIGNNKNFAFLLHNDRRIKMSSSLQLLDDTAVQIRVEHTSDDRPLLSWTLTIDARNYTEVGFHLLAERFDERCQKLQTLVEGSFEYLIFTKRPYALKGVVEFDTAATWPNGTEHLVRSHIDVALTAGISEHSVRLFEADTQNAVCPREMLLFNPPPTVLGCVPEMFANVSALSKYTLDVMLANVSAGWDGETERLVKALERRRGLSFFY